MNRKLFVSFLVISVLLFASTGAVAQSLGPAAPQAPLGTGFTYQGQLKQNATTVNAICDMVFRLHDTGNGSTQVASATTANSKRDLRVSPDGERLSSKFTDCDQVIGRAVDGNLQARRKNEP